MGFSSDKEDRDTEDGGGSSASSRHLHLAGASNGWEITGEFKPLVRQRGVEAAVSRLYAGVRPGDLGQPGGRSRRRAAPIVRVLSREPGAPTICGVVRSAAVPIRRRVSLRGSSRIVARAQALTLKVLRLP